MAGDNFTEFLNASSYDSGIDYTTNGTLSDNDSKIQVQIAYAIGIPILCAIIIIGNLGTMYAFWKLPDLWEKPSEMLILSLSFADLMAGIVVVPLLAPLWISPGYWPGGEIACMMCAFSGDVAVLAGLYSLCAISIDRFLLVYKEYPQYMKIQSRRCVKITIAIVWGMALLTGTIEMLLWDVAKNRINEIEYDFTFTKRCLTPTRRIKSFAVTLFVIASFVPVAVVSAFSAIFFVLLRKRLKKSRGMRAESQIATSDAMAQQAMKRQQRKQYIKPAIVLLVLDLAMAVSMLPYWTYNVIVQVFCPECLDLSSLYLVLLAEYFNSLLDPFLYVLTQRQIQRFYKTIICGNKYKP